MNKHMMKFLVLLLVWLGSATGVQAAGEAAVYYIQTDQLNTPRVITDQSQAVVWKWESDGFGATPPNEQPGAAPAFVFNPRFAGQYFDRESNLHYNYFRDYDPQSGRYLQSDPIGLGGGINTYGYAGSNPLINVDPDGKFFFLLLAGPSLAAAAGDLAIFGGVIWATNANKQPMAASHGPKPERSIAQESQADLDHDFYKKICEEPPPPNLDKCEAAKWEERRAKQCMDYRKDWDDKFWPGRHLTAIQNEANRMAKWAKIVAQACTCP